jgi:hypothetical protein
MDMITNLFSRTRTGGKKEEEMRARYNGVVVPPIRADDKVCDDVRDDNYSNDRAEDHRKLLAGREACISREFSRLRKPKRWREKEREYSYLKIQKNRRSSRWKQQMLLQGQK